MLLPTFMQCQCPRVQRTTSSNALTFYSVGFEKLVEAAHPVRVALLCETRQSRCAEEALDKNILLTSTCACILISSWSTYEDNGAFWLRMGDYLANLLHRQIAVHRLA